MGSKGLSESKIQQGLTWNMNILPVGDDLACGSCAATHGGPDPRAFPASCNGSDNRSNARSDTRPLGCLLAARFAGHIIIAGDDGHNLAGNIDTRQFKPQLGAPLKSPGLGRLREASVDG